MKKCILLFFGAILFSIGLNAQTTIPGGYFSVDRTLTLANSPYITSSQDIAAGAKVTIEKGVEIRFNSDTYFQVFGTLNANGVKFTANNGSTAKGYWRGLYVAYEGNSYFGNINLDSCNVEYAQNIWCRKGTLTLRKTTIDNFSGNGVILYALGTLNITESNIKNCNVHPINLNGPGLLTGSNTNNLTGNTNDYIYFEFNDVSGNFNTPKFDIPYRLTTFRIGANATWNIEPGVELKSFNSEITINGKIKAPGTTDKPIIFDMHPGSSYWLGVTMTNSAIDTACIFQNCIFKGAIHSSETYEAMEIVSASPTIENCKFTGNYRNLRVTGISKPTFTNCNFEATTQLNAECYNIGIDMNANIDFSTDSIKFNSNEIRAVKIIGSTVIDDGHLKKLKFKNLDNPTYCLYDNTIVHDTASLIIDPGVVIKCRQYNSYLAANGTLTGIGTEAEPIIFTHLADDNFGNPKDSQNDGQAGISNSNSGRLMLYGTTTSQIKNWKIYYGGYNSSNWAVYVTKGNIVENCEIKNSHRGIYFSDNAQILNNSFSNINSFPLGRNVTQGTPVLIGNTVASVGTLGILITGFANDSPTLESFDFAGITNAAYVIESNLAIAAGNVVTVEPGVVIKFQSQTSGFLTVNGALKSIGTESNKIIFTSINDDSAGGDTNNNGTSSTPANTDWQGLDFTGTASDTENFLKNCEVRYSGYYYFYSSIRITDCRVVMDSTKVNFCYWGALGIFGTANPEITNCQFYNMNNAPIYMDMFSNPTFSGNTVANLPRIGLRIRGGSINGTIPARNFAGYNNITYIIDETMTVPNTKELIIPAGLSFKGNGDGRWNINGKLQIQGTMENPVVFTAQEDDLYGSPNDLQQNGNTTPGNSGNFIVFYDDSDDASKIEYTLFRYSSNIPIQTSNASPKILNTTFQNIAFEGIYLAGSSTPTINGCSFNNITFPFTTSLVTYPAETTGNTISGTTGRAIKVTNETLTQNATLSKREFGGIANIPYVFQNYTVGTGAKLTINPGVVCKFVQNGYLRIQNGLIAKGGSTVDSTIVFTADRDDFYGGDTYGDGDSNLPTTYHWKGIYFYNESIDENCILENCIFKNASDYYYYPYEPYYDPNRYAAITLDNSSPTIKSCLFESNYYGIISRNTSLPKITNCDFVGTDPTYGYGIQNQTATNTVTAENCWWNHNTGPRNASNPGGLGERVSNYVDFTPWATQLAKPVLGDVSMNGEVKPFDASLVLQHAVASIVLTEKQKGVADVSGNNLITSYDASLILQYSVGIISKFDPEPLGTKSAKTNEYVEISFPSLISEPNKKTFEIPLTLSTFEGVKAVDMKYTINQDHVKFLKINKDKIPSGISLEAGVDSKTGEVIIAMASAYDLNLDNQQIVLEFEFAGTGISESMFSLNTVMANDNFLANAGTATIIGKSTTTGLGDFSQLTEPVVIVDHEGIHTQFNLSKSNQDLFVQVFDLTGRTLYRKTFKNLTQGMQYIDMSYSDFENPGRGICILNLKAGDFSLSKKLLLK